MAKDLTVGNPTKVMFKFAFPLFASIIFQQLYNLSDSFVAGRYIDMDALASVGSSYEITLVFIAFAFGCNIGCSVIVSNLFGSKKFGRMKTAINTTFISAGILCTMLMVLGFLLSPAILRLINTPESLMKDSLSYLNIYIAGLYFLFFYNITTGIFSAMGDSKTPFFLLACSSVANIFVNIYFVRDLHMGINGVAWATFICQGISCVISVIILVFKIKKIKSVHMPKLFDKELFLRICRIAVPSILQQSFISVGNIMVKSQINIHGGEVIAGFSSAIKINNIAITSFTALGNAVSNFTSQNHGAGKIDRIKQGYRAGLIMILSFAVIYTTIYCLFGNGLTSFFMKEEDITHKAVNAGRMFLLIASPGYILVATKLVADGVLRGLGEMKLFMIATLTDLVLRVVLAVIFQKFFGLYGIYSAWPIGWFIATVMAVYFYKTVIAKKMRQYQKKQALNAQ